MELARKEYPGSWKGLVNEYDDLSCPDPASDTLSITGQIRRLVTAVDGLDYKGYPSLGDAPRSYVPTVKPWTG